MEEKREFTRSEIATVKTLAKGLIPINKERERLEAKLAKVKADIIVKEEELSNKEAHIRNVIKEFTKGYTLEEVLSITPNINEPSFELNLDDEAKVEMKEIKGEMPFDI